ncbi:MAG TPA: response regulator, partial [Polyangiaceae bacterium]|nr:response regulator [Polyangiaceae bacterium]
NSGTGPRGAADTAGEHPHAAAVAPAAAATQTGATQTGAAQTGAIVPTIRVDTRRLDDMMAHVREVAQTQVRLAEQARALQELCDGTSVTGGAPGIGVSLLHDFGVAVRQLRQDMQEFGHLVDSLSSSLNHVRMTPLSGMIPLWQRTVREAANKLSRPTHLEIDVGDTEVDIHLSELIKDPLLHILRNAVAHGIEASDVRRSAGKPAVGRIRLEARADGSFVELRITDDGRGIDPNRIAQKAVERGWVTAATAEAMSAAERRALVFLPGFSTAEVVTTIAGRGMGLHSVQRNLEELGGSVSVTNTTGLSGTTFKLRIPATVLSVKGLLVRSGGVTYALPLYDVALVAAVAASTLEQSEGQPIFRDPSGRPIRVRALDALLGRPANAPQAKLFLVVLRRTGQELALIVDSVLGEREFVTCPMPWNLNGIAGINGALILPDGTVALSLDSTVLFAAAQRSHGERIETAPSIASQPSTRKRILVVDDSLAVRTLESHTLGSAGYEVSVCADGMEAWESLQKKQCDLVVSDVQMPNMDGFELTTRIRASAALHHLPVILVTGLSSPADVSRGAEVGADGYIIKGELDQNQLLTAVRRLIH